MNWLLSHRFYAPEDAGAGSGGNADASGKSGQDKPGDGTGKETPEDKRFTQAEVEAIVKKRLERYSDVPELRKKVGELEAREAELQRQDLESKGKYDEALQRTEQRYKTEIEKALAERESWQQRYENLAIDNAVLVEAQRNGALDPADVLALVKARIKLGADHVPSFDDGKSVADGVREFLAAKPHLVKPGSRGGSGTNHQTNGSGANAPAFSGRIGDLTPEEVRRLGGRGIMERVRQTDEHPWQGRRSQTKD